MALTCEQAREYMADFDMPDFDADLASGVNEHLAQCVACAAEHEAMQASWDMLAQMPEIEPRADFRQEFWTRVGANTSELSVRRSRFGSWFQGLAWAAVVACAFMGGAWWQAADVAEAPVGLVASYEVSRDLHGLVKQANSESEVGLGVGLTAESEDSLFLSSELLDYAVEAVPVSANI